MKANGFESTMLSEAVPAILMPRVSLVLWSCTEENRGTRLLTLKHPRAEGKQKTGQFSVGEFWRHEGSFLGNAVEAGKALPSGRTESAGFPLSEVALSSAVARKREAGLTSFCLLENRFR
jgi:hypothetical protein